MDSLKAILSFLTIIPTKHYDIKYIAENLYLFPIAGFIIGIIISILTLIPLNPLIVAFIVTFGLIIITGAHHLDGLSDFADGLMVKGDKEKKMKVIHDPNTGSAGVTAIALNIIGLIISLSLIRSTFLPFAIIASEVLAKYSMVFISYKSRSAWEGIGSLFINIKIKKLIISTLITFSLIYPLVGINCVYAFILTVLVTYLLKVISNRSFGGLSGDVFGATNEIVRLSNLILFVDIGVLNSPLLSLTFNVR